MFYYGIVNQADEIQGKSGALLLFKERSEAVAYLKKSKSKQKLYTALFRLKHNQSFGKVL